MANRKWILLIFILYVVVLPLVYIMKEGMKQEFAELQEERRADMDSFYNYIVFLLSFQALVRSVGNYNLYGPGRRGNNLRPRLTWSVFANMFFSYVFFLVTNLWGLELFHALKEAKQQRELKVCKNLTRIAYTTGLYCYDFIPKYLNYYDFIEEVEVTVESCLK
ncbi:unnamed protein product [Nezara viridula]|uniref:Uncharacterized protein n=1 Tax=Nezara viridula TaxID=85310 RepID=A0A9P0HEV1_NEZVI|nr:unnamed protein product [Nezara viridula]